MPFGQTNALTHSIREVLIRDVIRITFFRIYRRRLIIFEIRKTYLIDMIANGQVFFRIFYTIRTQQVEYLFTVQGNWLVETRNRRES